MLRKINHIFNFKIFSDSHFFFWYNIATNSWDSIWVWFLSHVIHITSECKFIQVFEYKMYIKKANEIIEFWICLTTMLKQYISTNYNNIQSLIELSCFKAKVYTFFPTEVITHNLSMGYIIIFHFLLLNDSDWWCITTIRTLTLERHVRIFLICVGNLCSCCCKCASLDLFYSTTTSMMIAVVMNAMT